jgi:Xaa-Pro aminopeptidase
MDFSRRLRTLSQSLGALDGLLVTYLPNIRYLCGFRGSAGTLLLMHDRAVFFTDGRYTEQAKSEVAGARIVITRRPPSLAAGEWMVRKAGRSSKRRWLGVEGEHFTVAARRRLAAVVSPRVRIKEASPIVERARLIKDPDELALIREAVVLGGTLYDTALQAIRPGIREVEVAASMEQAARRGGADAMSFETIIAAGERSALPHGRASMAEIPSQGFVVCDFGVILHGYCSDRTRTVWVGRHSAEPRRVYAAVLEAQLAAIAAVRPGATAGEVDRAARNVLKSHGLGKYFTHSTGHGVGLEIHEAPRLARSEQEVLRPGMVITVEPGAYLPGKWGVRIEDMVVVTEQGCEVLAPTNKDFTAI